MSYDAVWAQKVYRTYAKLHTRVQQIDTCIQEVLRQRYGVFPERAAIVGALCHDIRSKGPQRLWRAYKRLIKRTPLDHKLLEMVALDISAAIYEVDVDKKQRQF